MLVFKNYYFKAQLAGLRDATMEEVMDGVLGFR